MLKLNKLFYFADEDESFCEQIEPLASQRKFLIKCKNDVRDHLRSGIKKATKLLIDEHIGPRFRTQGSWSYKTCVQPAFMPQQEIDWDYGVYLPVRVWEENGPPHHMAKLYFDVVENLLIDLCKEKNWELLSGKETCIRIQVANWAHIDIPLYAAPDHKFTQIIEKAAALESLGGRYMACDSAGLLEDTQFGEFPPQAWEELDDIVMATRSGQWKKSDPEAVSNWFNDRVEEHGEQLRRVSRYLKAWRDFHWKDGGGPTSVSLMIAIAQNFRPIRGRDDIVLEATVMHLSKVISGEIREQGIDQGEEDFNGRLSQSEKELTAQRTLELLAAIQKARSYSQHMKQQAIIAIRQQFGGRIPDKEDWVDVESEVDVIRETPPQRVAHPTVLRTKAG